jgi:hypothetical protein
MEFVNEVEESVTAATKDTSTWADEQSRLKTFVDLSRIKEDMSFNVQNLNNAMVEIAALYVHYSQALAKAQMQRDRLETQRDILEAQLDKAVRDKAAVESKKITEVQVKQAVLRQPKFIRICQLVNEAAAIVNMLFGAVKGLEMKRDMMVQVNKNAQTEFKYTTALSGPEMTATAVVPPATVGAPLMYPSGKRGGPSMKEVYEEARRSLMGAGMSCEPGPLVVRTAMPTVIGAGDVVGLSPKISTAI